MPFDVLGLDADEEQAYRALVRLPSATAEEMGEVLEIQPATMAATLFSLERRGLAARRAGEPERFVPARPSVAIGALLADRDHQIRLAEVELHGLEEEYRTTAHERTPIDVVDIVLGEEAVRSRMDQLQRGATSEVLALVKEPVLLPDGPEHLAEAAAVAHGITYRVVMERQTLDDNPRLYDEARRMDGLGERIRVSGSVPLKLVIVDRKVALLPISATDHGHPATEGALLVHRSGLLDALVALYEAVWADAFDLLPQSPGAAATLVDPAQDLDRQILALLLSGMTDQAVATNLKISVRTVQRHVRSMMERGRVDTRMQLGWAAATHGWLREGEGTESAS